MDELIRKIEELGFTVKRVHTAPDELDESFWPLPDDSCITIYLDEQVIACFKPCMNSPYYYGASNKFGPYRWRYLNNHDHSISEIIGGLSRIQSLLKGEK